jgi:4-hydroxybenzoate polyprenyltransferase/phosphoserine phosphatase
MAENSPIAAVSPGSVLRSDKPLCIDLDGTLVRTDTFLESILLLLGRNPFLLFPLLAWLVRGKAYFKARVAERTALDPALLPYSAELLEFLRQERARGRRLVLATASNEQFAQRVAAHLGLFDEVVASNPTDNLAGARKLAALEARFGKNGFAYAGNARVDMPIWRQADHAILVNTSRTLQRAVESRQVRVAHVFSNPARPLRALLLAARPHQWMKNLLIFIPLIVGHKLRDIPRFEAAFGAFVAFSLCASAVYFLNDVLDLEADRRHALKKSRAFASGDLPVWVGLVAAPVLLVASLGLAWLVNRPFVLFIAAYFAASFAYSAFLKRLPLTDVILLAGLYTLRIVAGGAAADIAISPWLLGFSMFFFLSLALVKRFAELRALDTGRRAARGYLATDLNQINMFGTASGYIAVLVFALYINSPDVRVLYSRPLLLWAVCPMLIYWISRVWLLANRGEFHEDPVLFALKDQMSYLLGVLVALTILAAL